MEQHWIDQYNNVEEVNLNNYSEEFLSQELTKYDIEEQYQNLIIEYQKSLKNEVINFFNDIIDEKHCTLKLDEFISESLYIQGKLNGFEKNVMVFKIEVNFSIYSTPTYKIYLNQYDFLTNRNFHDLNADYFNSLNLITEIYRNLFDNKQKIQEKMTELLSSFEQSVKTLKEYKYYNREWNETAIRYRLISNILKEKRFYQFINNALKDFQPLNYWGIGREIKIVEITKSGKSVKIIFKGYEHYIETIRVKKLRGMIGL